MMCKHVEREHDTTKLEIRKTDIKLWEKITEEVDLPNDVNFNDLQREKQTNKNGKFVNQNSKNSLYRVLRILDTVPKGAAHYDTVSHYTVEWDWLETNEDGKQVNSVTDEPAKGVFFPSGVWLVWAFWKTRNVDYKNPWLQKLRKPADLGEEYGTVARKSLQKAAKKVKNKFNDLNDTLNSLSIV